MWTPRWARIVRLLGILVLSLLAAGPALAQTDRVLRVRTDSDYLRLVIASGMQRSATFRAIVERLEQSDVIVEVQCGHFVNTTLAGRTVLLSAQPDVRYVLVEVSCPVLSVPALATLGHELRHALEIATARWVVDSDSLALLYSEIGFPNERAKVAAFGQFETADALDAGERIHHELFHPGDFSRMAQVITK